MTTPADAFAEASDGDAFTLRGDVLHFALRCRSWSQAEFSRRLGVHESTVSRILRGSPTSAVVARKVADLFPLLTIGEIVDLGLLGRKIPAGVDTTQQAPVGDEVPA